MHIPTPPTRSDADEFHAMGRDMFERMVDIARADADEAMQMHAMAMGMEMRTQQCDHTDCLRDSIRMLIATVSYAVVSEKMRRVGVTQPDLSEYTAAEGGAFDG